MKFLAAVGIIFQDLGGLKLWPQGVPVPVHPVNEGLRTVHGICEATKQNVQTFGVSDFRQDSYLPPTPDSSENRAAYTTA